MNNINKQDVENCMKKIIRQSHIPDENKIRQIVKEEIEKYHEKEDIEQQRLFSEKINEYFRNKKYKNIVWYILLLFALLFTVLGFKIWTESTQMFIQNYQNIEIIKCIIFIIFAFVVTVVALYFSIKIYDKMIKENYKNARIICLLEILYWCDVLLPEVSQWVENIL